MKTAREMFEELGYTCKENRLCISYEIDELYHFIFHKFQKQIGVGNFHITLNELKAIIQQCKELGWFEDEN